MQSDRFDADDPFLPATCWRKHLVVNPQYRGEVRGPAGTVLRECPVCGRLAFLPEDEGGDGLALMWLVAAIVVWAAVVGVYVWGGRDG